MSFFSQYTFEECRKNPDQLDKVSFQEKSLFQGCIPVGEFKNQHPIAEDGYYELGFVLLVILLRIVPS